MIEHSANRLASSISPYLQQHASNPVNWQPWDEQALAEARARNVPVLLSIGYAACHWCHVMEHESFADPKTAEQMNANFVCIKVDREERPDLDKTYQAAHYLLSRRTGGWPLTVFLDEELVPFFTGTYFPPAPRGGLIALPDLLERVHQAWSARREDIGRQRATIEQALRKIDAPAAADGQLGMASVSRAAAAVLGSFDSEQGGLGKAPKFPQAPQLAFALHMCAAGDQQLVPGLRQTLDVMACGGLHDHVGGGFYRYCVDPLWDIPHFEKMLYDNAQLLEIYARAASLWRADSYAYVAKRIAGWMLQDLQLADGGFASAVDADSEGEEGKYYLWTADQLQQELGEGGFKALQSYANLSAPPNFEGAYHLHRPQGASWQTPPAAVQQALAKLRDARAKRVRPITDDKALITSCALAARALTVAGLHLQEPGWVAAARRCLAFVEQHMRPAGGYRTAWREGRCSEAGAFLDDLAGLLAARLSLLQVDCQAEDLASAAALADLIIREHDDRQGGLLFAAKDAQFAVRKIRSCDDGPAPAGNGVAADSLLVLGWLLGRTDYLEAAERILHGFGQQLEAAPYHSPSLVGALARWLRPDPLVVLTGHKQAVRDWHLRLLERTHAGLIVVPQALNRTLPAGAAKPAPPDGIAVWAHVCRGNTCLEPIGDFEKLLSHL